MQKQKLLDALVKEREELLAVLDGVDEARLSTEPVCGTWTAKDVLSHLTATDVAILDVLDDARRGEVLVWPWTTYANGDDWNAAMVGARRDRPFAQVRAEFETNYGRLVSALESWPEEAGPFGADSWDEEKSPIGWLPAHDREHAEAISHALLNAQSTRPASSRRPGGNHAQPDRPGNHRRPRVGARPQRARALVRHLVRATV